MWKYQTDYKSHKSSPLENNLSGFLCAFDFSDVYLVNCNDILCVEHE